MAEVTLNGAYCVEPGELKRAIDAYNAAEQASALPIDRWWGKANSFTNTVGPEPGVGYFLVLHRDLNDLGGPIGPGDVTARFNDGTRSVSIKLSYYAAEKVTAGADEDPAAVYLVTAYDPRHDAQFSSIDANYNELAVCGYIPDEGYIYKDESELLQSGNERHLSGLDWDLLIFDLWAEAFPNHAAPPLPRAPHGKPINIHLAGTNAFDSLNTVLDRLDMAINFDHAAGTFSIAEIGSQADALGITVAKAAHEPNMTSSEPVVDPTFESTDKLRVYFPLRMYSYGQTQENPSTQDTYERHSCYYIEKNVGDDSGETTGTIAAVWDDLIAFADRFGAMRNDQDLEDRATDRADAYKKRFQKIFNFERRTYSGVADKWKTSGLVSGVKYHQLGDGLKTSVVGVPWIIKHPEHWFRYSHAPEWSRESVAARPDVARDRRPANRFVWGVLNGDLEPFGQVPVTVLAKAQDLSNPEINSVAPLQCDWFHYCRPWQIGEDEWFETSATIWGHDWTGQGGRLGDRVFCAYHHDSCQWQVIVYDNWDTFGILLSRQGPKYTWTEIDPGGGLGLGGPGTFRVLPRGKCGFAYHLNGQSHNSQGGIYPEIVRMYYRHGWYFEYSVGPHEMRSERYKYNLGDYWDVNFAPYCTKGVILELVGIGGPSGPTYPPGSPPGGPAL